MTKILLITNKSDVTTDFIVQELQRKNIYFYRFNTEDLCKTVQVVLDFESENYFLIDKTDKEKYNLLEFTDIYYRRPELPKYIDADLSEGEISFLQVEIYYTLEGIYRLLDNKHWFNNVYAIRETENKIYQLLTAKEVGLTIPKSLLSNEHESTSLFLAKGTHIIKPVHNARIIDSKEPRIVFTSEVNRNITKKEIEFSVNYFQEKIDKEYDIRATFVGEKCFAVAIDSQSNPETSVDWRKGEHILNHTPIELPDNVYCKCLNLMKRLKLHYGAIDFILDKRGNYIFLEINPNGQWAWIEHLTGLPIAKEIVKQLCNL